MGILKIALVIVAIVYWIIYTAKVDAGHILEGEGIKDHTPRTIQRICVGVLVACIHPFLGLITALLFWALFDTILNYLRGLPLSYIGNTAKTDIFFTNHKYTYWALKGLALFWSLILITYI